MGYRLNCLDEPVLIAVSKPLPTEFGIHHSLESFVAVTNQGVCFGDAADLDGSVLSSKHRCVDIIILC